MLSQARCESVQLILKTASNAQTHAPNAESHARTASVRAPRSHATRWSPPGSNPQWQTARPHTHPHATPARYPHARPHTRPHRCSAHTHTRNGERADRTLHSTCGGGSDGFRRDCVCWRVVCVCLSTPHAIMRVCVFACTVLCSARGSKILLLKVVWGAASSPE